jgi:pimeloyl-ACP methyl ester carboxylesterase
MSQGGFVALRAALRYPDFVRGIGLIDTQAGVEDPDLVPQYRLMSETWQEHGLNDDLAEIIAGIIMSPGFPGNGDWIAKWKAQPVDHLDVPLETLFSREDLHDRLAEIRCPAIVFHGEADAAIPMEQAEALATGLPNCDALVRIPGAGHASNLSHPDAVNGPLLQFLQRHA